MHVEKQSLLEYLCNLAENFHCINIVIEPESELTLTLQKIQDQDPDPAQTHLDPKHQLHISQIKKMTSAFFLY